MGRLSPGGENLLDFLDLRQVLSTYDGDLRDKTGGFRKGQSPCKLLGGLLGFDGNTGNFFPTTQGQDPSSRAMRRKRGTSGYGGTMVLPLEWSRVCRCS